MWRGLTHNNWWMRIISTIKYMLSQLFSTGIHGIIRYLSCSLDIIVKFDTFDSNASRSIDLHLDNRLHYWSSPVHKGARYQYIWLWGQIFFFALSLNYDSYYLPLTCIVVGWYGGSNKGKGTTHTSLWGYMQMAALLIAITNLLAIF